MSGKAAAILGFPRSTPRSLTMTVAVTSLAFFIVQLDGAVLNVAIVEIGRSYGSSVTDLPWVINAYTLVYAALLLSAGAISDRVGARPTFIWGFAIFVAASVACALSPTAGTLITARAAQGVGAALLVPSSLALINQVCGDDAATRSRAVGLWAAAAGIAVAVGPIVSGLLVSYLGWRSIFLVNVPIGFFGIWMTLRSVEITPRPVTPRRFDWGGQILVAVALFALIGAIIEAGPRGWSSPVVGLGFLGGAIALAAFAYVESHIAEPILPLSFFRQRTFSSVILIGFVASFCMFGLVFGLAVYFQNVLHYTAVETGLAFVPFALTIAAGNVVAGRAAAFINSRVIILGGLLIAAAGCAYLSRISADTSYLTMLPEQLILRLGIAFVVPAMTAVMLASIAKVRSGVASGALTTVRQAGAAAGVALYGALMAVDAVAGLQTAIMISAIMLAVAAAVAAAGVRADRQSASPAAPGPHVGLFARD
jgi:DHA2 family methylenomycin A resistance protein-like MFS transporter